MVLDVVAGTEGETKSRLVRLRQARKDIKQAFSEAGLEFSLEVSRGKQPPTERKAWFVGDNLLSDAANDATRQIMSGSQALYDDKQFEPVMAVDVDPKPLVISYVAADDGDEKKAGEFVNQLRLALRGCNEEELADSLWFPGDFSGNQSRAEARRVLEQAEVVIVLWSTAWQSDSWVKEEVWPRVDPQRFKQHRRDCLGLVFSACNKPECINHHCGFDHDGQGGVTWMQVNDKTSIVEANKNDRDKFAQNLVSVLIQRLKGVHSHGDVALQHLQKQTREYLFAETHRSHYKPDQFEPPLAVSTSLQREAGRIPAISDKQTAQDDGAGRYPLLDTLIDWANDPDSSAVHAVLGEFGSGKTFTARMLARRMLEEQPDRLTLYIDLRDIQPSDIAKNPTLDTVLGSWLKHWRQGVAPMPMTVDQLRNEIARGALVIFDGFDEITVHLGPHQDASFLRELMRVVAPMPTDSKTRRARMLITCRSHYFPTVSMQNSTLCNEARGVASADPETKDIVVTGSILLPFSAQQIRSALGKHLDEQRVDAALSLIASTHDLQNLAERPYLLSLIRQQLHALERKQSQGKAINAVSLYRLMRDDSLQRDNEKHTLDAGDKCQLMMRLAMHLWRQRDKSITYEALKIWLFEQLQSRADWQARYQGSRADLAIKDLHTATFIVRDTGDRFRFAHTSLQEYFLAEYLFGALQADERSLWFGLSVSTEVVDFLLQAIDLSAEESALWQRLAEWSLQSFDAGASIIQLRLAQCQVERNRRIDWPGMDLRGADLSDWLLGVGGESGQYVAGEKLLNLDGACLVGAELRRSEWREVSLADADLTEVKADQSLWLGCDLAVARLDGECFSSAVFRACRFGEIDSFVFEVLSSYAQLISGSKPTIEPVELSELTWGAAGHNNVVTSCAFSPDGSQVLTGSSDGTARLWSITSGKEVKRFSGHEGGITSCAFSPDGAQILTGSNDGTARLWTVASGKEVKRFSEEVCDIEGSFSVIGCAFSTDGTHVMTGLNNSIVRLWSATNGEEVKQFFDHFEWLDSCTFSSDGTQVLMGAYFGGAFLCSLESNRRVGLSKVLDNVSSCAFSADGAQVLAGSNDGTTRLWSIASGKEVKQFSAHEGAVSSCAVSPDNKLVLSGSDNGAACLWSVKSGKEVKRFSGHEGGLSCCVFSPDSKLVLIGSRAGNGRLWSVTSGEEVKRLSGREVGVSGCAFSPDGMQTLTGSMDGTTRLWSVTNGKQVKRFSGHKGGVSSCAFSPDGAQLLVGSMDGTARLRYVMSGNDVKLFSGHEGGVRSCTFSPDCEHVLTGSFDGPVRLWSLASGKEILQFRGRDFGTSSCVFSPDGTQILTGSMNGPARLWSVKSGEELKEFWGQDTGVSSCAFSPDGKQVLVGPSDGTSSLWNVTSGAEVKRFGVQNEYVTSCVFSPDGATVLIGSGGGIACLWSVKSGKELKRFSGHEGGVSSCAFSPDGKQVLVGSNYGPARLWRIDSTAEYQPFLFWHFADGWASGYEHAEQPTAYGGSAWRWLRAFGKDSDGRDQQWMLEEILACRE